MLPVLWNLVIPASWAKVVAAGAFVLIAVARAHFYRQRSRAEGVAGVGFGAALWDDKWSLAALAGVLAAVWRAGYLDAEIPIPIHTYGLMIASAFLLAIHLAQREARRQGQDGERVGDLSFWILLAALVGSRVYFIAVNHDAYFGADTWLVDSKLFSVIGLRRIPKVFSLLEGGLVFYGGFIGAALTSVWYMRRHKMQFLSYADTLIPSVAFGHFLGRIGCFAAGCCWGDVAHRQLPWLARFPPESLAYQTFAQRSNVAELLTPDRATTLPVHPTQLYESFGELGLFALLVLFVRPRKRFHGQVLATWLMLYAVLRTVVETFRGDMERGVFSGFGVGQWTSAAVFATGLAIWIARRPKGAAAPKDAAASPV